MKYLPITLSIVAVVIALGVWFNTIGQPPRPIESPPPAQHDPPATDTMQRELEALRQQISSINRQLQVLNERLIETAPATTLSQHSEITAQDRFPELEIRQKKYATGETSPDQVLHSFLESSADTIRTTALLTNLQDRMAEHGWSESALASVECREYGCRIDFSREAGLDEAQILGLITTLDETPSEFTIQAADESGAGTSTVVYLR